MSERTEALLKKALAVHLAGGPEAALASYGRILRMDPFHLYALQLAGLAAGQLGLLDQAVAFFRRALRIDPKSGATHINLGSVYADFGRDTDAEKSLKAGLALTPGDPEAWLRIGIYNLSRGRTAEAMGCCTEALKLKPGFPAAFKVIGDIRKGEGEAVQAAAFYRVALKSAPENTEARLGLVQTLLSCNRVAESISECDRILAAHPRDIQARSHRLFLLNYLEDLPVRELFAEHQKYGILFPAAPRRSFPNPRDPAKRIRVAFLSRDLRAHAVAFFLEPIVALLDPAQFEVVLYHDHMKVDAVSERFRSRAALWRNFSGRPDAVVEGAIRADAPDVLFDLAGHTGQNRLHLFARRLAPVQISYLGYPNTTGLPAIDYRFTDEVADPRGDADRAHVERLVRFSSCAWAYMPPAAVDGAFDLPAAGDGETVSFGSFNNLSKVNDATLRLWAGVLAAVPRSRLILKSPWIDGESMTRRLVQAGMDPGRVTLLKPVVDPVAHLNCYRNIDVALDPFPYGGTTTTCEALWMGRPVVTLSGDRHSGRVGASLLRAIGKSEWIARSGEDYVRIARDLAADRSRLGSESQGLREALRRSPLLDHAGQARRFGEAIRACWSQWCDTGGECAPTLGEGGPADAEARPEFALS